MTFGSLSPLTLAYYGDAVLCRYAREAILNAGIFKPADCTRAELNFVTAEHQALAAKELEPIFTEEEKELFRRAKNAKSHSAPRHTDLYTYRLATALEAVIGHLALSGDEKRARFLFETGFKKAIANLTKA